MSSSSPNNSHVTSTNNGNSAGSNKSNKSDTSSMLEASRPPIRRRLLQQQRMQKRTLDCVDSDGDGAEDTLKRRAVSVKNRRVILSSDDDGEEDDEEDNNTLASLAVVRPKSTTTPVVVEKVATSTGIDSSNAAASKNDKGGNQGEDVVLTTNNEFDYEDNNNNGGDENGNDGGGDSSGGSNSDDNDGDDDDDEAIVSYREDYNNNYVSVDKLLQRNHLSKIKDQKKIIYPFPPAGQTWRCVPPPGKPVITMSDYTCAMKNAVKKIWPQYEILTGMCSIHAWMHWHIHHREKFKDYERNHPLMGNDFEKLKSCPEEEWVGLFRELMLKKWCKLEPLVAAAWSKQWSPTIHTCVEMNKFNFFKGGIPSHNNNSESTNKVDKTRLDYRKYYSAVFTQRISDALTERSKLQRSFNRGMHKSVHCQKFYDEMDERMVESQLQWEHPYSNHKNSPEKTVANYLDVAFKLSNKNIPEGTLLIASLHYINEINDELRQEELERPDDSSRKPLSNGRYSVGQVTRYIMRGGTKSTVSLYKKMLQNVRDKTVIKEFCNDFDSMDYYAKLFYRITPLVANNKSEEFTLQLFLGVLGDCDLEPITLPELLAKKNEGLVCCTCDTYLRHAWCKHAFIFAVKRRIFCIDDKPLSLFILIRDNPVSNRPCFVGKVCCHNRKQSEAIQGVPI